MWRYLWERRPVRPGLESARRFIALKDFIIKTAVLVISRLLIILVYCVGVTQCTQRWFCILQDCAKYDLLYYSLLFFFFLHDKDVTSTRFLAPDFLPSLQPTLMFPGVRDLQPPTGHARSQGMCPCYSPSKVCYGLVTGSPELRHLLACLSEIFRLSQGKRHQE